MVRPSQVVKHPNSKIDPHTFFRKSHRQMALRITATTVEETFYYFSGTMSLFSPATEVFPPFSLLQSTPEASADERSDNGPHSGPLWPSPQPIRSRRLAMTDSLEARRFTPLPSLVSQCAVERRYDCSRLLSSNFTFQISE